MDRGEVGEAADLPLDAEQRLGQLVAQGLERQILEEGGDAAEQFAGLVAEHRHVAAREDVPDARLDLGEGLGEHVGVQPLEAGGDAAQRRQEHVGDADPGRRHVREQGREARFETDGQRRGLERREVAREPRQPGRHLGAEVVEFPPNRGQLGEDGRHVGLGPDQRFAGRVDPRGQGRQPSLEGPKIAAAGGHLAADLVQHREWRADGVELEAEGEAGEEAGDFASRLRHPGGEVAHRAEAGRKRRGNVGDHALDELGRDAGDHAIQATLALQGAVHERRRVEAAQVLQRLQARLDLGENAGDLAEHRKVAEGCEVLQAAETLGDGARNVGRLVGEVLDRPDQRAGLAQHVERIGGAHRDGDAVRAARKPDLGVELAGVDRQQGGKARHGAQPPARAANGS